MLRVPLHSPPFVPGAYADHLTSFGASFEIGGQTKIVQWLRNGAGATSGTVTEPLAHWRKFATANIFVHHRRGATVLEALYLSTACPLQLLPMGDPLAAPWAPKISVHIVNRPETVSGPKTLFTARRRNADPVNSPVDMENAETIWLTDGHFTATGDEFLFDSTQLPNGRHTIRAVVRTPGPLRHQCFDEVEFTVANDQATP